MKKPLLFLFISILAGCSGPAQEIYFEQEVRQLMNQDRTCDLNNMSLSKPIGLHGNLIRVFTVEGECDQSGPLENSIGMIFYANNDIEIMNMGTVKHQDSRITYDIEGVNQQSVIYGVATKPIKSLTLHYADADIPALIHGSFFIAAVPDETNPLSYTLIQQ